MWVGCVVKQMEEVGKRGGGGVLVSEEVKLKIDVQMMEVVEEMETSSPE